MACTSNIGYMDNQLGSILADLKAAKESKFLISFDTRSHIFGSENASESVPYLTVRNRREENVLLFCVLYTKL